MKAIFGIFVFLFSMLADGMAILAISKVLTGIYQPIILSASVKSDAIFLV